MGLESILCALLRHSIVHHRGASYSKSHKEALGPSWSLKMPRKPVLKHVFPSSLSSFPQFPKKQTRFTMVSVGSCAGDALGLERKGSFIWDYRT